MELFYLAQYTRVCILGFDLTPFNPLSDEQSAADCTTLCIKVKLVFISSMYADYY